VDDALLGSSVRAWRIPSRRQVVGERQQCVTVDLRAERGGSIVPSNPILGMSAVFQRVSSSRATRRLAGSTSS
jgi:hypothetical protein